MKLLNKISKIAVKIFWIIGSFLLLFLITDLISAYKTLSNINIWLGYFFIVVVLVAVVWIVYLIIKTMTDRTKYDKQPKIKDWDKISDKKLKAFNSYLLKRHDNLLGKDNMKEDFVNSIKTRQNELLELNNSSDNYIDLIQIKQKIETELYPLTFSYYLGDAEEIIETSVRDIMLYVIISPYRAIDLFVVIIRNLKMYNKLIDLFKVNIPLHLKIKMLSDILKIIVAVNYLNLSEKVIEELMKKFPLLNTYAGDITQGIGAGILSNSFGHLALKRITSLKLWNEEIERNSFKEQIGSFTKTVVKIANQIRKSIFIKKEKTV